MTSSKEYQSLMKHEYFFIHKISIKFYPSKYEYACNFLLKENVRKNQGLREGGVSELSAWTNNTIYTGSSLII